MVGLLSVLLTVSYLIYVLIQSWTTDVARRNNKAPTFNLLGQNLAIAAFTGMLGIAVSEQMMAKPVPLARMIVSFLLLWVAIKVRLAVLTPGTEKTFDRELSILVALIVSAVAVGLWLCTKWLGPAATLWVHDCSALVFAACFTVGRGLHLKQTWQESGTFCLARLTSLRRFWSWALVTSLLLLAYDLVLEKSFIIIFADITAVGLATLIIGSLLKESAAPSHA